MFRKRKGQSAEDLAISFIKGEELKIIARNFRTRMGEIDIIALDKDTLVFLEVRSVSSLRFGHPEESITPKKQQKLVQTAEAFLKKNRRFENCRLRFDFIGILWNNAEADVRWIKNIFEVQ